ncbi:hypothetical protein PV328_001833 [Microctonus aethiopoides]|uniref:DUF4795 domain-containing protein n=1 Tax=Microctonus aethiopoides TaxID=144406 RepID=A0AA39FXV3_9HYME|nr:hypothetical protein PV328_001833 [Microctonus aethiopoides]
MAEDIETVQVLLPQILDLALGTPEVGSVNFNILHNFLHILLHQLNLTSKNVEYRGDNANRIKTALGLLKAGSNPVLQAYNITESEINNVNTENATETPNVPADDPSITLNHEQTVPSATPSAVPLATPTKTPSIVPSEVSSAMPSKAPSVVPSTKSSAKPAGSITGQIPPSIPSSKSSVIVPNLPEEITRINDRLTEVETNISYLNDDMAALQSRVGVEHQQTTASSISSKGIKSSEKSQQFVDDNKLSEQITPILEHTTSSIVTTEGSQNELSSSRRSTTSSTKGRSVIAGVDLVQLKADVIELQSELSEAKKKIEMIQSQMDQNNMKVVTETLEDNITTLQGDDVHLNELKPSGARGLVDQGSASRQSSQDTPTNEQADEMITAHEDEDSSDNAEERQSQAELTVSTGSKSQETVDDQNERMENLDETKIQLTETIQNMEKMYNEAVRNLESRVAELENEMKTLNETISTLQLGDTEGIREIQDFAKKMQDFHADIEKVNRTAARLFEEHENKETHTNVIIEQIELLKTIKADKEELEEALADKADAGIVSYDRFNIACDDLARGVEDTITKLTRQEYVWQQSLDAVQQEIDNKLDKVEISPIREFVNNRLQSLQDKIKELAEERRDNEAAGTRKVLTGLQCISCDKNAVMKIEPGPNYNHNTGPFARNIKPYSSCKMDLVKKQQKKCPGRNMNQFNAAMLEMGKTTKPPCLSRGGVIDNVSREYLCNRYCGGSHTVTTAQQRIMRMGHFLAQWGPEVVEMTPGVVRGTDGQLYHSTPMPAGASAANYPDVCGPTMPTKNTTCCGMQNSNSTNQQSQRNRTFQATELQPAPQRRANQKDQKRGEGSVFQSTRRLNSKKIAEIPKNDRPVQITLDNPMTSSSVPLVQQNVVNGDAYFNTTPGEIDDDNYKAAPSEVI